MEPPATEASTTLEQRSWEISLKEPNRSSNTALPGTRDAERARVREVLRSSERTGTPVKTLWSFKPGCRVNLEGEKVQLFFPSLSVDLPGATKRSLPTRRKKRIQNKRIKTVPLLQVSNGFTWLHRRAIHLQWITQIHRDIRATSIFGKFTSTSQECRSWHTVRPLFSLVFQTSFLKKFHLEPTAKPTRRVITA